MIEELNESLNTPVEFYMTDDTIMPKQIYGTARVGDTDYGFSLVLTKYDRVYGLDLYRVVQQYRRFWNFKTPSDIRPVLSTVIKFVEASYPFIKSKMDGIIIDIPGKTGSEAYERLVSRAMKTSYVKTFRVVPVQKTTDMAKNYIFLVKKGLEPKSIFKTATFWKHFEFDPTGKTADELFTSSNVEVMDEPYKAQKLAVSLKPSKKYAFDKFDVETTEGFEDIAEIEAQLEAHKKGELNLVSVDSKNPFLKNKKINVSDGDYDFFSPSYTTTIAYFVSGLGEKIYEKYIEISDRAFSTDVIRKKDEKTLKDYMEKAYAIMPPEIQKQVTSVSGIFNEGKVDTKSLKFTNNFIYRKPKPYFMVGLFQIYPIDNQFLKTDSGNQKALSAQHQKLNTETNIAVPKENPFYSSNETIFKDNNYRSAKLSGDTEKMIDFVYAMPEVANWNKKFFPKKGKLKLTEEEKKGVEALVSYTGSSYSYMNSFMRGSVSKTETGLNSYEKNTESTEMSMSLIDFFDKHAPRISEPIWVWRNADVPGWSGINVGDEVIDPGFLSTTIDSEMMFGGSTTRIKIFIPKGSRVLPILDNSSMSGEKEIVLPPMSVLRVTELVREPERVYLNTIYTGNANKSYGETLKKMLQEEQESGIKMSLREKLESIMREQMKDEKKPAADDKWAQPMIDFETMKKIADDIKTGKLTKKQ